MEIKNEVVFNFALSALILFGKALFLSHSAEEMMCFIAQLLYFFIILDTGCRGKLYICSIRHGQHPP
jgi:hypothetical protein